MAGFVDSLLNRRFSANLVEIPSGYPEGENGLNNIFMDIDEEVCPLGFDDDGEGVTWPMETLGLQVFISREGGRTFYVIRPLDEQIHQWLLDRYKELHRGNQTAKGQP